jgi:Ca-activated chloride channel family protein
MMEQLANKGNGNYYYIDSMRMAERVFGRDFTKMLEDVAQDVKIQVEFDPEAVASYRLIGYENRNVADQDFRNDQVDAGEIGAGHQVTALYELTLTGRPSDHLATVRVRAKKPRGSTAKEVALQVPARVVTRRFTDAPEDMRFATAVMGGSELLRQSPHARGWTYARVISIVSDTRPYDDEDRAEFLSLMKKAARLSGEEQRISAR